jgi:hypothetical protein
MQKIGTGFFGIAWRKKQLPLISRATMPANRSSFEGLHSLNKRTMKVAVVGATGLVGTKMLQVLAERNFPVTDLIPVASPKSIGKSISFRGGVNKLI